MLPSPLDLLARTLPLGDAGQLRTLMQRLTASATPHSQRNWLHRQTPAAVERRYPRQHRINEAELAARRVTQDSQDELVNLDWLDGLFDGYFRFDGSQAIAREDKRLAYARLCAKLHPALPVAWKISTFAKGHAEDSPAMPDLSALIDCTQPNFLPQPHHQHPWADLHVHLGGSQETSLGLFSIAISRHVLRPSHAGMPSTDFSATDAKQIQRWLTSYQALFSILLERLQASGTPLAEELRNQQKSMLRAAWQSGRLSTPALNPKAWLKLHATVPKRILPRLAHSAIREFARGNAQQAWLYWLTALCLLFQRATHSYEREAILAFINISHLLRDDMIHDGVGLTRFVRYFLSPLRKHADGKLRDADGVRQLLAPAPHHVELKLSDWIAEKKESSGFIRLACSTLAKADEKISPRTVATLLSRMHGCLHFQRSPQNKARPREVRFMAQRKAALGQGIKIDRFLNSASAARARVHGVPVDLTAFIRGLDVAGDETATPIEVFAPVIRWLRRPPQRVSGPGRRPLMPRLHLSIHAGEDYNHLLSGMRHMDETVRFCQMDQGDRIGHGLALGIAPGEWIRHQQEVFISCDEHLDNLVWAWHYAVALSGRWPDAAAVALRLAARIDIYAPYVYRDHGRKLEPSELFRAWLLRQNCPVSWNEHRIRNTPHTKLRSFVPDADRDTEHGNEMPHTLYQEYHRQGRAHSKSKRDHVVLVRCGEQLPSADRPWEDWMSRLELDFMEALQDHLITQYSRKGLTIEVNPSSNVYVGRIPDYHHHPIFRWHPPDPELLKPGARHNRFGLRAGPLSVCVNTDDPGIFPTSLSNEFHLLGEAAKLHLDVGPGVVNKWLAELRDFGMERFNASHQQLTSP